MNEWFLGLVTVLAVLACPAMMLAALVKPWRSWHWLKRKVQRTGGETPPGAAL